MIHNEFAPIISDVQKEYVRYRKLGENRQSAITKVKALYSNEMCDDDDSLAVLIGLVLALSKKKELTREIVSEINHAIHNNMSANSITKTENDYYIKIKQILSDESLYGNEAAYAKRLPYIPSWVTGDVFCHTITHPNAKRLGIYGWFIIVYKVGEFEDESRRHIQLVYITVCPPDKKPLSKIQLESLGFLPMMAHDGEFDYLAQVLLKSQKDELSYELTKIGSYLDVRLPANRTNESPLTAMPLFSKLKKDQPWLDYEDLVCRLYKKYGKYLNCQ